MNNAENKMKILKKQLETRLKKELTETETIILKLAFEEGREEGRQAQKEYILSIITAKA